MVDDIVEVPKDELKEFEEWRKAHAPKPVPAPAPAPAGSKAPVVVNAPKAPVALNTPSVPHITPKPAPAPVPEKPKPAVISHAYPRWVTINPSRIVRSEKTVEEMRTRWNSIVQQGGGTPHVTAGPDWPKFQVTRDGKVMVVVNNAEEEAKATSPKNPT